MRVSKVTNRTEGADDEMGIAVWEIELEQDIPLEFPVDANLADWLRTNATWDIPGGDEFEYGTDEIGVDGDVTSRTTQPQT